MAGVSSEQRCQSSVASAECRSCDQAENRAPTTSLPYWNSDDDGDEGSKPSELYWKHTWKIDNFSKINKRELKSDTFEVGGYKWYILIYPQGCDVCNHLSLFLCVADHDKLLPGWRQFAQFTIAVVNKDPKKSKYSDTLHRFFKKEHDWGWKKFMELSKLLDGFIDADTLIIKAQVQVIRNREDRPFRCLDSLYRRELVRVYLTNVEQICRRFSEERQGKLKNLIDDKARWSSFRAFWLRKDQNYRQCMSREKTESILKVLVKQFFIEKEVTSTLVMDSLYSGLKALEDLHKGKISKGKYLETDELPIAIVRMENDTFVLVDDVLTLLEKAAIEPVPPKDEKAPQNRTKDGSLGEDFNKDSNERDERRLTELGRRTIEIFTLAHIFSKIEVSYQEAVSLQRQEELIREEEVAWLARRGKADKEKKSKKKQGKQKRNNRKGKDKGRDEKFSITLQVEMEQEIHIAERNDFVDADLETTLEKFDVVQDSVSNTSDCIVSVPKILEDKDVGPVKWDIDISEVNPCTEAGSSLQNGTEGRSSSVVDDSSSTCSSDSVPFVVVSGSHKSNSRYQQNRRSPGRCRNPQSKPTSELANNIVSGSSKAVHSVSQVAEKVVNGAEKCAVKDEGTGKITAAKDSDMEVSSSVSLPRSPSRKIPTIILPAKSDMKDNASNGLKRADKSTNSGEDKFATKKPSPPVLMSRPLSARLIPDWTPPILPCSSSSAGRLGPEPPQSYQNAIVGGHIPQNHPEFLAPAPSFSFGSVNPNPRSEYHGSLINDEFPHLDIINDLLDDEHGNPSTSYQDFGAESHCLNRQFSFPGLDRTRFYNGYGSPRMPYDARLDMALQGDPGLYGPNHWQMDLPFVGFGNAGGDGFRVGAYQNPPSVGVNGFTVFQQSSEL